jgi:hypothetical protein
MNALFYMTEQTMVHKDNSEDVLLDMCTIRAEPVLNFYNEHLDLPKDEINKFNMKLEGIETQAGLVIMGKLSLQYFSLHIMLRFTKKFMNNLNVFLYARLKNCFLQGGQLGWWRPIFV